MESFELCIKCSIWDSGPDIVLVARFLLSLRGDPASEPRV